jgi:uncharacterized protein with HEPN domain
VFNQDAVFYGTILNLETIGEFIREILEQFPDEAGGFI